MANSQRPSAAPALSIARRAAIRRGFGGQGIVLTLGLAWISQQRPAGAGKWLSVLLGNRHKRRHKREGSAVRFFRVKIEGFFADRDSQPAAQHVPVVVDHLPERSFIYHRLLVLPALALLALVSRHRHAAEFDALDGAPGFLLALLNFDSVEARVFERIEEEILAERAGDAAAPEFRVLLQVQGNVFVGNDVGDDRPATALEDAKNLRKKFFFVLRA